MKEYIYQRVVLNKIQGEALHVLRTLGPNPTWEATKEALINNFGIQESYHQLYQQAFEARNVCITKYYKSLREILCKLNEKYEYDKDKPLEFSPLYVEQIILKTFLNNIDINLASVVINRNIDKLRDAFNLLEREGLIRMANKKTEIDEQKKYTNDNNNSRNNFNNRMYINNPNNNSANRSMSFNSNQTRRSINSNPNQRNFQRYSSYVNGGNIESNSRYNLMEVEHVQVGGDGNVNEEQVNFHTIALKRHFH